MPRLAGRVLLPDGSLSPGAVEIEGNGIAAVVPASGPVPARILAPGFVDLQVNGLEDVDVATAAGPDWERLDRLLLAQGVTAWCPTVVTAPLDSYGPVLARVAEAAAREGTRPAVLGAHLEGPFLGAMAGAHDRAHLVPIDLDWLARAEPVRVVTLGPEADGALDAVAALTARGVTVALGHTAATYDEAEAAAQAGARLVTHLFNAMVPLHHRQPGIVGAALTDPRLTPTVIADLVHVHPVVLLTTFRARAGAATGFGDPGVALVTDAVAWRAGRVGGVDFERTGQDVPRRADGTIAGSTLSMDRAVRNTVAAGVAPGDALRAASQVPCRVLGEVGRGRLVPGCRADLVVLSPELEVLQTWVGGAPAWER